MSSLGSSSCSHGLRHACSWRILHVRDAMAQTFLPCVCGGYAAGAATRRAFTCTATSLGAATSGCVPAICTPGPYGDRDAGKAMMLLCNDGRKQDPVPTLHLQFPQFLLRALGLALWRAHVSNDTACVTVASEPGADDTDFGRGWR